MASGKWSSWCPLQYILVTFFVRQIASSSPRIWVMAFSFPPYEESPLIDVSISVGNSKGLRAIHIDKLVFLAYGRGPMSKLLSPLSTWILHDPVPEPKWPLYWFATAAPACCIPLLKLLPWVYWMSPEAEPRGGYSWGGTETLGWTRLLIGRQRGSSGSSWRSIAGLRVWWSFCTGCRGVKADTGWCWVLEGHWSEVVRTKAFTACRAIRLKSQSHCQFVIPLTKRVVAIYCTEAGWPVGGY